MTDEQKQKKDYQKKYREKKKYLKNKRIISIIYKILKIFYHLGNYKTV